MLIVGCAFAIRSERAICRDEQVNLAYRSGLVSLVMPIRPVRVSLPARVWIAEPPIASDHFLTAHLQISHAAILDHGVAASVGQRTPRAFVGDR